MQCSVYCVHGIKYSILCSGSRVLGAEYCVVGSWMRYLKYYVHTNGYSKLGSEQRVLGTWFCVVGKNKNVCSSQYTGTRYCIDFTAQWVEGPVYRESLLGYSVTRQSLFVFAFAEENCQKYAGNMHKSIAPYPTHTHRHTHARTHRETRENCQHSNRCSCIIHYQIKRVPRFVQLICFKWNRSENANWHWSWE